MRVTGGSLRSRALRAPRGQATRPTSDRVREALFGILASSSLGAGDAAGRPRLEGARVLDLYAGTGALAIEALSRGAARAVLVESSREALAALRANVEALGLAERTEVLAADARAAAVQRRIVRGGPFDLVLADPPWALVDAGEAQRVLAALVAAGALSRADALVVLEHSARTAVTELAIPGLELTESRRYGDTALAFYKPAILATPRPEDAGSTSE
jgi:16S rRNA (guanine966-N2)-methyltransferase